MATRDNDLTVLHVIRLRGPWESEPIARTQLLPDGSTATAPGWLPPSGRVMMPCDWGSSLGADFFGRVRYTRKFNWPNETPDQEHVHIIVGAIDAFGNVSLNGKRLGAVPLMAADTRFEITKFLERHNKLSIEVELPRGVEAVMRPTERAGQPGGLVGEVRLEVVGPH